MEKYHFTERVKAKLLENEKHGERTIAWLMSVIDKTPRWFYNIESIEDLQLKVVRQISAALNFDFLADYYRHLGETGMPPVNLLNESEMNYKRESPNKEITINFTIRGNVDIAGEVLQALKKETEKKGFKID